MDWNYISWFLTTYGGQLVGFVLPPVVTLLNRDVTDSRAKFLVALFVCLVASAVLDFGKLAEGTAWSGVEAVTATMILLFTESQVVYRLYFKGSVLEAKVEKMIAKLPSTPEA